MEHSIYIGKVPPYQLFTSNDLSVAFISVRFMSCILLGFLVMAVNLTQTLLLI